MALRITVKVITQLARCLYVDRHETPQNRQHLEHLYESTFRRTAAIRWLLVLCGTLVVCSGLILFVTARACLALEEPMRIQDAVPSLLPLAIALAIVASMVFELITCNAHGQWRWSWHTVNRAVFCGMCGCFSSGPVMSLDELERQFSPTAPLVDVQADMAQTARGSMVPNIDASAFDFGEDSDAAAAHNQINIPMQTMGHGGSGLGSGRSSPTDGQ